MTNGDVILFIRDEMLANPHNDASRVYNIAKLSEEDNNMFQLMRNWMYETDDDVKTIIFEEMEEYLEEKGLF